MLVMPKDSAWQKHIQVASPCFSGEPQGCYLTSSAHETVQTQGEGTALQRRTQLLGALLLLENFDTGFDIIYPQAQADDSQRPGMEGHDVVWHPGCDKAPLYLIGVFDVPNVCAVYNERRMVSKESGRVRL